MYRNKSWINKTISHREAEAIPYYFDFTPPARIKIEKYYGSPIEDKLEFPIRMTGLKTIKPLYADPSEFGETAVDEFGVVWSTSEIDRGVPIRPCLTEPDLSGYKFPDCAASYRFEDIDDWCSKNREDYLIVWVGDLWERATFMRGMENILLDLAINQKFVETLLHNITDYILETMKILFDSYKFDGIAVSDDYGAQNSMLMSPSDWKKLIKPHLTEIYKFAKDNGRTVLHHSDGHIYPIIGDMIDIGCDILHPVQPESMNVFDVKREFGRHLTLWGGMRTQDLLAKGTPDEIMDEVKKLKQELGRGGGYIISNGITIQSDVPLENMIAMIEEARKID